MANRAIPNAHARANAAFVESRDDLARRSSSNQQQIALQKSQGSKSHSRSWSSEQRVDGANFTVTFSTPTKDKRRRQASGGACEQVRSPDNHQTESDGPRQKRSATVSEVVVSGVEQDEPTLTVIVPGSRETLPLLHRKSDRKYGRQQSTPTLGREGETRHSERNYDAETQSVWGNQFADDPSFAALVRRAEQAILNGQLPERIVQGSSGSYFLRDASGRRIGVFKPKDEEPYGQLNPKFTKWMHKVCCPCCFGRSCLVPNQGYLSEAGAYLVDLHLQLRVVPATRVVRLASQTFNYDAIAREKMRLKRQLASRFPEFSRHLLRLSLPSKVGSLQTFVAKHQDADYWLRRFDGEPQLLAGSLRHEFLVQFQRLVVLDYVIRNTDRGNDNWLIRYDYVKSRRSASTLSRSRSSEALTLTETNRKSPLPLPPSQRIHSATDLTAASRSADLPSATARRKTAEDTSPKLANVKHGENDESDGDTEADFEVIEKARVRIAAIDNGLAFPFKHPDELRSYPFGWSWLAIAKEPFLDEVAELVLPRLEQPHVDDLVARLREIFRKDRGFDAQTFERQMDVMRGQMLNLRRALRERRSPAQLVAMPAVLVHKQGSDTRQSFRKRNPFFSCW